MRGVPINFAGQKVRKEAELESHYWRGKAREECSVRKWETIPKQALWNVKEALS